jgi:transposase
MAAPYSEDLRRKIVPVCKHGTQSQRKVAEFFNVSLSFVEALLSRYRRSGGELVRQRHTSGRQCCLTMLVENIAAMVAGTTGYDIEEIDRTLAGHYRY